MANIVFTMSSNFTNIDHRTLRTEIEMVDIVQKLLNDVDTNVTFEANFETFLSLYFAKKQA